MTNIDDITSIHERREYKMLKGDGAGNSQKKTLQDTFRESMNLTRNKQDKEAIAVLVEITKKFDETAGTSPETMDAEYKKLMLKVYDALSYLLVKSGRLSEALEAAERGFNIAELLEEELLEEIGEFEDGDPNMESRRFSERITMIMETKPAIKTWSAKGGRNPSKKEGVHKTGKKNGKILQESGIMVSPDSDDWVSLEDDGMLANPLPYTKSSGRRSMDEDVSGEIIRFNEAEPPHPLKFE